MYDQREREIKKVGKERCFNRTHRGERGGRRRASGGKKGRGREPSLTTSHVREGINIERTEVAGAVFGAEQLVAFQLKEMFATKALLVNCKNKNTKKR